MIERYSKLIVALTTQEYVDKLQAYGKMSFEEFKSTIESFMAEQNVPFEFAIDVRLKNGYSITQDLLWRGGKDLEKKLQYIIDHIDKRFFETSIERDLQTLRENGLNPDEKVKDLLRKNGFIFEMNSFGLKREQFSWNGFTVTNAGFTMSEKGMRETLDALQPQVTRMQKLGFGQVLYGPLIILNGPLFGQVYKTVEQKYQDVSAAAIYSITKDTIYLNKNTVLKFSHLSSFSHELGHRHYYKVLSPSQRQRWEAHFQNRGVFVTEEDIRELYAMMSSYAPKKTDYFMKEFVDWSEFDWGKFLLKLNKNSHMKEIVDFLAQYHHPGLNIKTARRKFVEKTILGKEYVGGVASCALRIMLFSIALKTGVGMEEAIRRTRNYSNPGTKTDKEALESAYTNCFEVVEDLLPQLIHGYAGKQIKISHSTSEYGMSNPSEDYAEAFSSYIMNMEMPEDILQEFIAMNHIRMGSKKKALRKLQVVK